MLSNSDIYGTSSWQYQSLDGKAGPYTITGNPVHIYMKVLSFLHANPIVSTNAGLLIYPVVDGTRLDYCTYNSVNERGDRAFNTHKSMVCDFTIDLPAGTHTIGFEHRYIGYRIILYGNRMTSRILIEEMF